MTNLKVYAVRDENTGKLVSDITKVRKKYWDKRGCAENSCMKALSGRFEGRALRVVEFKLVEVQNDDL